MNRKKLAANNQTAGAAASKTDKFLQSNFVREFRYNKELYLMLIPVLLFYLVFHYKPMYGAIIAFKDFVPVKGILGSPWVGMQNFIDFFNSHYFSRILTNTLIISFSSIVFSFPAPIILALLINELKSKRFASFVKTVSYMPHFISLVVICSLIIDFTGYNGIITKAMELFGFDNTSMLTKPGLFVPIYVLSGIWQGVGWGSIIYLAALSGVDQEQYEAAKIDGANRWKQTLHITLPGIIPTIIVMLILRLGNVMSVGYEKIILLYNPVIYETADVISSFVYRKGILEARWSYSAAVGLFNSTINFLFLVTANWISRKVNNSSLW